MPRAYSSGLRQRSAAVTLEGSQPKDEATHPFRNAASPHPVGPRLR